LDVGTRDIILVLGCWCRLCNTRVELIVSWIIGELRIILLFSSILDLFLLLSVVYVGWFHLLGGLLRSGHVG
jgi:hypothetical protein